VQILNDGISISAGRGDRLIDCLAGLNREFFRVDHAVSGSNVGAFDVGQWGGLACSM